MPLLPSGFERNRFRGLKSFSSMEALWMQGCCAICEREERLTRHHPIPRARHHNKRNKREFSRQLVREVVGICRPCHSQIHQLLTEKQLEREFNTVAKLRDHPEIAKFARWIGRKPAGFRAAMRSARIFATR